MASSFTQLFIHAVFAVKFREALISPDWEAQLHKVICTKLKELGHSPIITNGTEDHIHMLWRHNRNHSLPETMRLVKGISSHWVNHVSPCPVLFRYQHGYGAFTVSPSRVKSVIRYIRNQRIHHQQKDFLVEYASFLSVNNVKNIEEYQFDPLC